MITIVCDFCKHIKQWSGINIVPNSSGVVYRCAYCNNKLKKRKRKLA
jgi:ribosomal protein L24E